MAYSVSKLKTKAQCDELIAKVQKQKADLQFEQTSVNHQQGNFSGNNSEVEIELQSINTEITGVNTIVATLPEGKTKDNYLKKQASLVHRQLVLEGKIEDYGSIAQLQNEFEIAQLALQIAEADKFLAELQTRKAELPS